MRTYGKVHARFWTDDKVRSLSAGAKNLFLYLLTSPHASAIGCYRLPVSYICEDTGLAAGDAVGLMGDLEAAKFVEYDEPTKTVYIKNWMRYNPPENRNVVIHCRRELAKPTVPERFRNRLETDLEEALAAKDWGGGKGYANGSDTVTQPVPNKEPEKEPEPEPEPEKEAGGYAFAGRVVKLSRADFAAWQRLFHAIPDLRAELTSLDAHYHAKGGENWFLRTSSSLNREHQKRLAEAASRPASPYRQPEARANRERV